jgi:hypothetical protein
LKDDYRKLPKGNVLVWDKVYTIFRWTNCIIVDQDNQTSVEFVAACSNLRSYVFGIAQKSLFDVKCKIGGGLKILIQDFPWKLDFLSGYLHIFSNGW